MVEVMTVLALAWTTELGMAMPCEPMSEPMELLMDAMASGWLRFMPLTPKP